MSDFPSQNTNLDFHLVVCCTASGRVQSTGVADHNYIQGAGDDSESWSQGLTCLAFWKYHQQLLKATEEELPDLIKEVMTMDKGRESRKEDIVSIAPMKDIYLGTVAAAADVEDFDGVIICADNLSNETDTEQAKQGKPLHLQCGPGKLGSRALREQLHRVPPYIGTLAARTDSPKILIACSTGADLSVGVALVVSCLYFDDECKTFYFYQTNLFIRLYQGSKCKSQPNLIH